MLLGEDFFKDTTDDFSSGGASSYAGIKTDRVPMIEKVFKEVLGRKPSSRELAFYKYGVAKEDGIRSKLVKSEEHKKLIEKALELPSIESELKNTRVSERKLLQGIEDIKEEMLQAQKLLDEKNMLINDLRSKSTNPYDLPTEVEKFEEGFDVYDRNDRIPTKREKRTFKKVLIEIIDILLK